MTFFPDTKTFVEIGGIGITWYAVLILLGALIAYYLTIRNFKKRGYKLELVDDLFYGGLISGVVGARLWYVLFSDFSAYLANPIRILDFREGGLAIHGGLFAGVLYAVIYLHRKRYTFMRHADEAIYNILIAQGIGRWGNFMNQEAYGGVVDASFYNNWPDFIANNMFINGEYRQPTFLFESILNITGWFLIHFVLRRTRKLKEGDLAWAYLMWYGVVRFFIEGLRTDSLLLGDLRIAQLVSIAMVLVGLAGFMGLFRKIFKAKKPVLIFDFDGTVADTVPIIIAVFKEIYADYEMSFSDEELYSMVGPTLEETFTKYLPDENLDDMVARYRARNRELHPAMIKTMPNAKEVLTNLKDKGYRLAVASNKKTDMIEFGLELLGMSDLFELFVGSDMVQNGKPNIEMIELVTDQLKVKKDNVVYMGDTSIDIETGKAYNAYTIGYHPSADKAEELQTYHPNAVITDWEELTNILEQERLWIYNTKY
ncbi:MAG: prolipoprotein diacylglyceryl transferase [Erysipelothrix sp.]|nr:prolipoprotein diacylglyceryl transferase [Erysipelothrix sp.]